MDCLDPFRELARTPDSRVDLTRAALAVARIEHPDLDIGADDRDRSPRRRGG
jgi:hypothetical protein